MRNWMTAMALVMIGCGAPGERTDGGLRDGGASREDASIDGDAQTEDPCASSDACGACTARGGCGFCLDDEACRSGTASGPSDGRCDAAGWAWITSDCSTCEPSCAAENACGDDGCGGSCGRCDAGLTCGDARVCVVDPTRVWEVTLTRATIDEHNASGGTWDALGGAPDTELCMTIGGTRSCSPTRNDTLEPRWEPAFSFGSATATALQVGVPWVLQDADVASDDEICSGTLAPDADALADGQLTVRCEFASFVVRLTPE